MKTFLTSFFLFVAGWLAVGMQLPESYPLPSASVGVIVALIHWLLVLIFEKTSIVIPTQDDVDEPEKIERVMDKITVSNNQTYAIGAYVLSLFAISVYSLLAFIGMDSWIVLAGCMVLSVVIFSMQLQKLNKPTERAIALWLGGFRKPWSYMFGGGWVWVPKPLMTLIVKDTAQQAVDGQSFTITVGTKKPGGTDKSLKIGAEMSLNITFFWVVWDIWKFAKVDNVKNELIDVIESAIRSVGTNMIPTDFILAGKDLVEGINKALQEQTYRWGIHVFKVNIKQIKFARKELQESYEKMLEELMQRESETIETFRFDKARDLLEKMGVKNPTKDEIMEIVQTLLISAGQIKKTIYQFDGESNDAFTRLASILANQPKDKP